MPVRRPARPFGGRHAFLRTVIYRDAISWWRRWRRADLSGTPPEAPTGRVRRMLDVGDGQSKGCCAVFDLGDGRSKGCRAVLDLGDGRSKGCRAVLDRIGTATVLAQTDTEGLITGNIRTGETARVTTGPVTATVSIRLR